MKLKTILVWSLFLSVMFVEFAILSFNFAYLHPNNPCLSVPIRSIAKNTVLEVFFNPGKEIFIPMTYLFSFNFTPANSDDPEDVRALARLLGFGDKSSGPAASPDDTSTSPRPGIRIPVRLTIKKVGASGILEGFYDKQFDQVMPAGYSGQTLDAGIDYITLSPAEYLIRLEMIDSVPQLAPYPVAFRILSRAK